MESPIVASEGMTGEKYVQTVVSNASESPVVSGADEVAVAWEVVLKATEARLDARVTTHLFDGVTVLEFLRADGDDSGRLLVSLGKFTMGTADALGLASQDRLILRGDLVDDSVTLTIAPRLEKNLVLLERVAREVSL